MHKKKKKSALGPFYTLQISWEYIKLCCAFTSLKIQLAAASLSKRKHPQGIKRNKQLLMTWRVRVSGELGWWSEEGRKKKVVVKFIARFSGKSGALNDINGPRRKQRAKKSAKTRHNKWKRTINSLLRRFTAGGSAHEEERKVSDHWHWSFCEDSQTQCEWNSTAYIRNGENLFSSKDCW